MPLGFVEPQHFAFQFALSFSFAPFVHVQYAWLTSQHSALAARQHILLLPFHVALPVVALQQ